MADEKRKKPIYKRWWFWLIVVIIVIAIASGGGDDTEDNKSDTATEQKDTNTKKTKDTQKTYGIGEPVKVGDVVFTVNDKSSAKNVGGQYGANASGTFLILDVTVRNEGKEALTVDSSFFKLYQGDTEYEASTDGTIYANESGKGFFLESVNPNLELKGKVVFDVADPNAAYTLQVQTGFFGTETEKINLQ
ncbi:DUF4352 domain-containing protein [Neobacillus dielmonensis]|uniref:DUF4352 domain-containing protein n=1 Tax=Neobacillus dielmonensis TaxID=1347369 RepID=UPI0005A63CFD|nr:DUF4352 domain-containing protein [Neobacillus dielmonensis]